MHLQVDNNEASPERNVNRTEGDVQAEEEAANSSCMRRLWNPFFLLFKDRPRWRFLGVHGSFP